MFLAAVDGGDDDVHLIEHSCLLTLISLIT